MTHQEAKLIACHLGLTLRKVCSGEYRVNFPDADDSTAYYTDNLDDAINAAVEMVRKRALSADAAKSASVSVPKTKFDNNGG